MWPTIRAGRPSPAHKPGLPPAHATGRGTRCVSRNIRSGQWTDACASLKPEPEAKGFDWTTVWCKHAYALYGKSMYWRVRLGLLEPNLAISRAACRGFLPDLGVFPDLEGAFPDPEKYFQNLYIAEMALDLQ